MILPNLYLPHLDTLYIDNMLNILILLLDKYNISIYVINIRNYKQLL
jgi:hypothetical protein